jgi:hypothetical protein
MASHTLAWQNVARNQTPPESSKRILHALRIEERILSLAILVFTSRHWCRNHDVLLGLGWTLSCSSAEQTVVEHKLLWWLQ